MDVGRWPADLKCVWLRRDTELGRLEAVGLPEPGPGHGHAGAPAGLDPLDGDAGDAAAPGRHVGLADPGGGADAEAGAQAGGRDRLRPAEVRVPVVAAAPVVGVGAAREPGQGGAAPLGVAGGVATRGGRVEGLHEPGAVAHDLRPGAADGRDPPCSVIALLLGVAGEVLVADGAVQGAVAAVPAPVAPVLGPGLDRVQGVTAGGDRLGPQGMGWRTTPAPRPAPAGSR